MTSSITITDKRTDVWSRDFIIWKINSGLWSVVWAGLWNKRVWADYERILRAFFSCPHWIFFDPEKVKKWALKVAHNRPRTIYYFTVQPRPQPTDQNWFFILWNLETRHLFSYLCSAACELIYSKTTQKPTFALFTQIR